MVHHRLQRPCQIDLAQFPKRVAASDAVSVEVHGSNIGVAPMYSDWDGQLGLFSGDDRVVSLDVDRALTVIQPEADEARGEVWALDARNTYIEFANDLTVIDGQWGTDGGLDGGWSVLGEVAVA